MNACKALWDPRIEAAIWRQSIIIANHRIKGMCRSSADTWTPCADLKCMPLCFGVIKEAECLAIFQVLYIFFRQLVSGFVLQEKGREGWTSAVGSGKYILIMEDLTAVQSNHFPRLDWERSVVHLTSISILEKLKLQGWTLPSRTYVRFFLTSAGASVRTHLSVGIFTAFRLCWLVC